MQTIQVGWRLRSEIVEEIQRLADADQRSVSSFMNVFLANALKTPSPSSPNGFPPQPYMSNNIPPLSLTSPSSSPDINTKAPRKRASRLSEDWAPSVEQEEYARNLGLDPRAVAEEFRDYWIAKAGPDALKADWSATWRNWCRRQAKGPQRASYGQQRPFQKERPGEAAARMFAEQINRMKDIDHE